jgi:hypothetical protein
VGTGKGINLVNLNLARHRPSFLAVNGPVLRSLQRALDSIRLRRKWAPSEEGDRRDFGLPATLACNAAAGA